MFGTAFCQPDLFCAGYRCVYLPPEHRNIRQITVALGIVKAVAHNKGIGYLHSGILYLYGDFPPGGLVHKRTYIYAFGVAGKQVLGQITHGQTGIHYVLHYYDIHILYGGIKILAYAHRAA